MANSRHTASPDEVSLGRSPSDAWTPRPSELAEAKHQISTAFPSSIPYALIFRSILRSILVPHIILQSNLFSLIISIKANMSHRIEAHKKLSPTIEGGE